MSNKSIEEVHDCKSCQHCKLKTYEVPCDTCCIDGDDNWVEADLAKPDRDQRVSDAIDKVMAEFATTLKKLADGPIDE